MTKKEISDAKKARKAEKRRDKKQYGKGEAGRRAKMAAIAKDAAKKKAERAQARAISSVDTDTSTEGASMYGKKHGSSMAGEKYDAKEAYNKNLTASARLHYLENERHDKTSRPAIHKHMRNFGASMENHKMGSSMKGTPPGSRMQNLAKKAMNKKPAEYHTSGMPDFITSRESGKRMNTMNIDEGNFSKITTKIPERSKVTAMYSSDKYQKGEEFYIDPKSQYKMKKTGKPTRKK